MNKFGDYLKEFNEVGFVTQVTPGGIVCCDGLPKAHLNEVVLFETNEFGKVLSLAKDSVTILVFSNEPIRAGTRVVRTNEPLSVPAGLELLGQVVTALCDPVVPSINFKQLSNFRPVDAAVLDVTARRAIVEPLLTGVTVVDMLVPLGKGQRQLVIGDRKTGKTNFLLKTMLTQAQEGSICIYTGIGKKLSEVKRMEEFFLEKKVMDKIIMVTAGPEDSSAMLYTAPFTAMAIAEYFRDQGIDTLVVLDDLSTHARFAREIGLLAKQFPGRDSYPVNIFYTHAKLLERAGNFILNDAEVSISCLPVAETARGDLSGYIQTNLMSMTDGHIYFDIDLFESGVRPAINPFLSVTRVGHQAQSPLLREISQTFMTFLTKYQKLQGFAHFGAELSSETGQALETGQLLSEVFLHQHLFNVTPLPLLIILFAQFWLHQEVDMDKMNLKYQTSPGFKKQVDGIVASSPTFDKLLEGMKDMDVN